jgi:hypothetical protein
MVLGCILLLLILNRYEFKLKVSSLSPAPHAVALAPSGNGATENYFTEHL